MTNKKFWLGMLGMVLAFGMTVVGCSTSPGNSNDTLDKTVWEGTWVTDHEQFLIISFNSPNFQIGPDVSRSWITGTYSLSGNTVTLTVTQTWDAKGQTWGEGYIYEWPEFSEEGVSTATLTGSTLTIDNGTVLTKREK
jgi:hypothetical protein